MEMQSGIQHKLRGSEMLSRGQIENSNMICGEGMIIPNHAAKN